MLPSRSILFFVALLASISIPAQSKTLKVLSDPPGATLEFDGQVVGKTPYEHDFPPGYFQRPWNIFKDRLDHPIRICLTLGGYITQEIVITTGPKEWMDRHNRSHGQYWLFKMDEIRVNLLPLPSPAAPAESQKPLPSESSPESLFDKVIARATPAIVSIVGPDFSGSGFFVDDLGLIATNAHLIGSQSKVMVVLPSGQQVRGQVVYTNPETDLAFIRVQAPATGFQFQYLPLAGIGTISPGDPVVVIGFPAKGMSFSVTKGIVSAIGKRAPTDSRTWIQTDASLNVGNSGGPLLNVKGEVIGIATEKPADVRTTGIAFAVSTADLSSALRELAVAQQPLVEKLGAPSTSSEMQKGMVHFLKPEGALVYIDAIFRGQIPVHISLSPGVHTILFSFPGYPACARLLTVTAGLDTTLNDDCFSPVSPPR